MVKQRPPPFKGWTPKQPPSSSSNTNRGGTTPANSNASSPNKRLSPLWSPWSTGSSSSRNRNIPQHVSQHQDIDPDDPRKALDDEQCGGIGDDLDAHNENAPINQGLISKRRKPIHPLPFTTEHRYEWLRPYWLGGSLFLILFAFWLLDSLKDPIFARLVDGQISTHQPPAKLVSVVATLLLVCLLELWTNRQQQQQQKAVLEHYEQAAMPSSQENILDPGGIWRRMPMSTMMNQDHALDDTVSIAIFFQIGVPYVAAFLTIAYLVSKFEQTEKLLDEAESTSAATTKSTDPHFDAWYVLGYAMYATIESFGSLAVATFWSYTNSTLSLQDAERYYGTIIATAQLGAIGGSTLVASGRWEAPYLLVVVSLFIVLQLVLMQLYDRKFEPTSVLALEATAAVASVAGGSVMGDANSVMTWQDNDATLTKPFWSGLYLIFQHRYVMLILGVSCLYEICMTLFDYQMKLLGLAKFEHDVTEEMSFVEFMGRYGQVVNFTSLVFSSILFPWMIRRFGLRKTLMLFPTMLLFVAFLVYGALPGNLSVLFFSLSLLKAMTYSIHDPSKEMLYIPTSNAVKFRAKFWIDVVGERILKAVGSAFNTLADTVEQSVKIGRIPSFLSALGLWLACYYVGIYFDKLLATGKVIGLEYAIDPSTYSRIPHGDGDEEHADNPDGNEPSEVEILFEEDNVSTLDLMADPVQDAARRNVSEETSDRIELPSLIRI